MERYIGKVWYPRAVISAPAYVQDFPARYSPQMGFEGANVIFDTWIHPLVMGLEEHLLAMFREDFEFHDDNGASHHGGKIDLKAVTAEASDASGGSISGKKIETASVPEIQTDGTTVWQAAAEKELKKILRCGKAKRNTEKYAEEQGVTQISVDTLYEAKAHYAR